MPIYEYRCNDCGSKVEVLERSNDSVSTCPRCGALLTEKLPSVTNVSIGQRTREAGQTCCGQGERCDTPPCSDEGTCWRG